MCGGGLFCFCGDWCVSWFSVMLCVAVVCCRSGVSNVHGGQRVTNGRGFGGRGGICEVLMFDVVGWWAGHEFI